MVKARGKLMTFAVTCGLASFTILLNGCSQQSSEETKSLTDGEEVMAQVIEAPKETSTFVPHQCPDGTKAYRMTPMQSNYTVTYQSWAENTLTFVTDSSPEGIIQASGWDSMREQIVKHGQEYEVCG